MVPNCQINLILTWSTNCVTYEIANQATAFAITNSKIYVPVVTLSTQENATLLQQLKSGFKRSISWNEYQSKVTIQGPNPYLDHLCDPSSQGVKILFVLSFENNNHRTILSFNCRNKRLQCYDR